MYRRLLTIALSLVLLGWIGPADVATAQITWDGGGDGTSWSDPLNWSANTVPTAGDDVVITSAVITIDVAATVGTLGVSGGTLQGTEDLTINGKLTWSAGIFSGSGTVSADGGVDLLTSSTKTLTGRTLIVGSASTWEDGSLAMGDGGVFEISDGTTLTVTDTSTSSAFRTGAITTEPIFRIAGTMEKDAGSTSLTSIDITVDLTATGMITAAVGEIDMGFGGTHLGTFAPSGSGIIEFDGGTHEVTATASGTGTMRVANGTANFNAGTSIGTAFAMTGGTTGGSGTATLTGLFTWSGGLVTGTGTLAADGGVDLLASSTKTLTGRTLAVGSASTWEDGSLAMGDGGVFEISDGATLTITDTGTGSAFRTGTINVEPLFRIAGTLAKSAASTSVTSVDITIDHTATGMITAAAGEIDMGFGGTHLGSLAPSGSGIVEFDGGTHEVTATASGTGTVRVGGGTTNFNAGTSIGTAFAITGGTAGGVGDVTVTGLFTWSAGTVTGTGTFAADGGVDLLTSSTKTLTERRLTVGDASTWQDGGIAMGDSGIFEISDATTLTVTDTGSGSVFRTGTITTEPIFRIAGTMEKDAGSTSVTSIDVTIDHTATGMIAAAAGEIDMGFGGTHLGSFAPSGSGIVEFDGGTHEVTATASGTGTVRVAGGTASFNAGTSIGSLLTMTNGTIGGVGDVTVTGLFTWSAGTVTGTGTFAADGGVDLLTSSTKTLTERRLTVGDASTWQDGGIGMGDNAVFEISDGATLTITDTGTASAFRTGTITTEPIFRIAGTMEKDAGSTSLTSVDITIDLTATGTIGAAAGEIDMGFGGTHLGTFAPSGSGIVEFDGGTHEVDAVVGIGTGTLRVAGGTVNFNETADIAGTMSVINGAANFEGATTVGDLFNVALGTVGGAGDITVSGPFTWSGGTVSGGGTLAADGGVDLLTSSTKTLTGRTLTVGDASTWQDGGIGMGDNAVFEISDGATLTVTDTGSGSVFRTGTITTEPIFRIAGTMEKDAGSTSVTSIDVTIDHTATGMIAAAAGEIDMGFGGTHLGSFAPSGSGIVEFDGGTHEVTATASGTGTLRVASGTVNLNTGTSIGSLLTMTNGTIGGVGDVTVTGLFTWSAGTVTGTGTFAADGGVDLLTSSTKTLTERRLTVGDASTWQDGSIGMGDNAVFEISDGATLTLTDTGAGSVFRTGTITTEPIFRIAGMMEKDAGSTDVTSVDVTSETTTSGALSVAAGAFDMGFVSTNEGLFTIGSGATLELDGGTHTNAATGVIGGTGTFSLPSNTTFTNLGTFAPGASAGLLNHSGDHDQTAGTAALDIELGGTTPGAEHDQIAIDGTADLGGILNVSAINNFNAQNGDAFVILTTTDPNGVSGQFQTLNGLSLGNGITLAPVYNADNVTLVASQASQEADLALAKTVDDAAPMLGGTVNFTVTLTNNGPDNATSITIDDPLPTGLTFVDATPSAGTYDDQTGAWTLGDLANGDSETLVLQAAVDQTGTHTNTATITASGQGDTDLTNNTASASVTVQTADLAVTKTVDNDTPGVGDTVSFTVTLTNNGPDDAAAIALTDALPTGLTFSSATASQGTYDDATGIWDAGALANGGSETLTIVATVDQIGTIINTAAITDSDQPDPNTTNNTASVVLTVQSTDADLAVTKTVDNDAPLVGETVTFTVTAANNGPADATGVELTDALPTGLTFSSATPSAGTYDDGTGVWTLGALANGGSETLTIVATVDQAGTITNTATVTASDQGDVITSNNTASVDVNAADGQADLAVTKTVDNDAPLVGETVTFTVTAANNGPADATGVELTDALPTGLTFSSATPSAGTYDDGTGVWTLGALANGGSETLTIVATVDQAGTITNTATVTASDQSDPDDTNDAADAVVTGQEADLAVTKTVDNANASAGDTVIFTVTLTNNGPSDATGAEVTDALPAELTFTSATPSQGTYDDATGVWSAGDLANGASATLTIEAVVNSTASIINTATITAADQPDPNTGNNTASVTISSDEADLAVTKTVDNDTPGVGDTVIFTVTLTNSGPDDATGIAVTDAAPSGLTFGSASPSQGTYDDATGVWSAGDLANGASATLTILATVDQAGSITNTATITASDQSDPDTGNNTDSVTLGAVEIQADLIVAKTVDNTLPLVGETVTFTVTLTNAGPSDATGTAVTDVLPAGLSLSSATPSQGSYNSTTGVWSAGTLASGNAATLTIIATVTQAGTITNTATVTASDQPDPDADNNSGSVTIEAVEVQADLAVTKVVTNPTPLVGDAVTFFVTLTNNGPSDATGTQVTDALPTGLTFSSATTSQGTYDDATGIWDAGTLASGTTATLDITATVTQAGTITNTATVTASDQPDPDTGNDVASVTIEAAEVQADLAVTKVVDDATPGVGDTVTFTVTLTNNGPSDATGTQVTDVLPTGLTFSSATTSQGTYDDATGIWDVGSLAGSEVATLTIAAVVDQNGTFTNTAAVTASDQADPDNTNDVASVTVSTENVITGTINDLRLDDDGGLDEPPLAGVTVLLIMDGNTMQTMDTGADGRFTFGGLDINVNYDIDATGTGTVPETGEDIDVHYRMNSVPVGTDLAFTLPLALSLQKMTYIFLLQNLDIASALLLGEAPPVPLDVSYNEVAARELVGIWFEDVAADQIKEALARLVLAEIVLEGLYNNAALLSHETSDAMFDLVEGYLITLEVMNRFLAALREQFEGRLDADRVRQFYARFRQLVRDIYITTPANAAAALVSAEQGRIMAAAFAAILTAGAEQSLIDNLDDETLYNRLIVAGDQSMLALNYVPNTQGDLDQGVGRAAAFDFTGTFDASYLAGKAVLEASTNDATDARDASVDLRQGSNLEATIETILDQLNMNPSIDVVRVIGQALRQAETAGFGAATAITTLALFNVQDVDVPLGMNAVFDPGGTTLAETVQSAPAGRASGNALPARSEAYRTLLQEVVDLAAGAQRDEAIGQYGALLDLDAALSSALLVAQAPVYAAAQASQGVGTFDDAYIAMGDAVNETLAERLILYTQLLAYADDDAFPVEDLTTQAQAVSDALTVAEAAIGTTTELVADVPALPLVLVKAIDTPAAALKADELFTITAVITNTGNSAATGVMATLLPDATALLTTTAVVDVGTLAAGEERSLSWDLSIADTTKSLGTFTINLTADDARTLPASAVYAIDTATGTAIDEEGGVADLPAAFTLSQNYPNPFNPVTTIRFTVPTTQHVVLAVYDLLGRVQEVLVDGVVPAGTHAAVFEAGSRPSGVYLYRLSAGGVVQTQTMTLLK